MHPKSAVLVFNIHYPIYENLFVVIVCAVCVTAVQLKPTVVKPLLRFLHSFRGIRHHTAYLYCKRAQVLTGRE